jgi:hypothetical protein
MPFLPEDKTLSDARKEAASAGFKSMKDAASRSRTVDAAGESALYDASKALSHDQSKAWDIGGMSDQFRTKYGVGADELRTMMEHPEMGKNITLSPGTKKEYDAYMAQTGKISAGEKGKTKLAASSQRASMEADRDTEAATTPTPRRAQD